MAYSDQQMSGNKIVAIIIVGLIHVAIGYVLITGLAYSAVKKVVERVTTVDIEEPPPPEPEEEPPPPPEQQPETAPPPPVAPPPPISVATNPPQVRTQQTIPPPAPPALRIPPAAPVAPPAPPPPPPPPPPPANPPQPRNAGSWLSDSDYRSSWISRDYSGTVSFRLSISDGGRVSGCTITGGSAPGELKDATCRLIERRARFSGDAGSYNGTVRWEIPD